MSVRRGIDLFFVLAGLVVCCLFSGEGVTISLSLFYFVGMYLTMKAYNESITTQQGFVAVCVFVVLLVILPFQSEYRFIPFSEADGVMFDAQAHFLSSYGSIVEIFSSDYLFYVKLVGACYYLFGTSSIMPYMFSFWSFVISYIYLAKCLKLLDIDQNISVVGLYCFIFCPIEVCFAAALLREMPMQMLAIVALYNLLLYRRSRSGLCLLNAFLCSVIATMMHSGMIVLFLMIFLFLVDLSEISSGKKIFLCISFIIVFGIVLASGVGDTMLSYLQRGKDEETLIRNLGPSLGNTNYITAEVNSLQDVIIQLPYRLIMFAFAPFPWQVYDLNTTISLVLTTIPQYFMIYPIVKELFVRKGCKDSVYSIVCVTLLMLYLLCAMGTGAYGTAMRHRVKLYPFMILAWAMVKNEAFRRLKEDEEEKNTTGH